MWVAGQGHVLLVMLNMSITEVRRDTDLGNAQVEYNYAMDPREGCVDTPTFGNAAWLATFTMLIAVQRQGYR